MVLADAKSASLTRRQAWSLYTLQSLSAWSHRTYEFAAIVLTASLYPKTLTAASIRGVSTTVACACFSSALGQWIDSSQCRLTPLKISIWVQQLCTLVAYALWFLIVKNDPANDESISKTDSGLWTHIIFAFIVILGVFIQFGSIANGITVDREWLPTFAPSSMTSASKGETYDLTHLNAVLRRIDLICKIVTPFLFNFLNSMADSFKVTIGLLCIANGLSWIVELRLGAAIYHSNAALRSPKNTEISKEESSDTRQNLIHLYWKKLREGSARQISGLRDYFSTTVWAPSLGWALLHLTVLAYSASFITYLLEIGFSLDVITVAQATGSGMEVASTFFTPWIIHRLSRKRKGSNFEQETDQAAPLATDIANTHINSTSLETVGLCGISWQFFCLVCVVISLFVASVPISSSSEQSPSTATTFTHIPAVSIVLLISLSLSRAGYWSYELTTQELTQTLVPAAQLSSFAGTQQALLSLCELTHWIGTAVWSTPRVFPRLAGVSLGAVGTATSLFGWWVWQRRQANEAEWIAIADVDGEND